jgi:serine/threonine protein kinase
MRDNLRQPPDKLPVSFGRYRLVKLLGKGGMGSVYLAHDSQLDRSVALKVPQLDEDSGSPIRERFFTEARAAAALNHPHICRIHDVGEVDGVPYLTMAYIDGKPLNELARLRPLLHRQSAILVWKVAVALHEAHTRGIIHRDLKPANIMIDKRGEPSIMDFGLARRAGKGDARITQTGEIMGTPAYMSPEQMQGNPDAIGPASDVYSLGVILYELLAGRLPFTGDVMVILSRVLLDDPPPPSRFCPDLAPELEDICLKAMAKQTKYRYASMAEFAAALFDHLHHESSSTQTITRTARDATRRPASDVRVSKFGGQRSMGQANAQLPAPRKPDSSPPRRHRRRGRRQRFPLWPVLAGAAAVLIVVLLIIWLVSRGKYLGRSRDESVSVSVRCAEAKNGRNDADAIPPR